jgi:hypothetical protein
MTDETITEAVLTWIAEALPEVQGHEYPYLPGGKALGLPDCAAELESREVRRDDPDFPMLAVQQAFLRIRRYSFSFMVDAGESEADAQAADATLHDFADRLEVELLRDLTLGQRVPMASPFVRFDYTPPLVRWEDGTIGRQMLMALAVAELVQGED